MANEHSQIVPSMQPTSTVADFKFWCQKVLPLVYDDSLSYYEVLNKMVVYLNQVIDNINADTANVAELEDDFLLLQTYVNNFFDDIDQLVTYAERAEAAETAALSSAASAAESATNAASSAVNAATSSGSAATSALSAMDAKDAAVAAKTAAETALANAQTAATNAANSATAAGNSADAASGSATAASGSAINAAASATSAQQSFTLADAARTAAQTAATNAAASAASADGAKAQAMIATEEQTTATSSHSIGDYFRISGVLYRATADIQIGDTISVSTNCEQVVLGDAVSGLSSQIPLAYDFTSFIYTKYFKMALHKEVQIVSGLSCERDVNIFNIPVNTNANDAYMSHRLLGIEDGFQSNYTPDVATEGVWIPIDIFKQKSLALVCEYTNILGDTTGVGQTPRMGVYYKKSDNTRTDATYVAFTANTTGKAILPIQPPEDATHVLFVFNIRVKKASGGLYKFSFENYIPS